MSTVCRPARALRMLFVVIAILSLGALCSDTASAQNRPPARISEIAPNPIAQGTTRISFYVPTAGTYNLKIFTVDGSLIASILEDEASGGGTYFTTWDGRGLDGSFVSNGIYFCRLQFGRLVQSMPVLVMR
jgi:hypothetical protein